MIKIVEIEEEIAKKPLNKIGGNAILGALYDGKKYVIGYSAISQFTFVTGEEFLAYNPRNSLNDLISSCFTDKAEVFEFETVKELGAWLVKD